ncbi:MAG: hypothetical protein DYG98_10190 [Haliscomenobacteraceae bacterium CHB4]|nr:hypothetical protein [Saprospiraceae bacterium]MCE7923416.1 hypothetical protein [Haliscomenobacteraceae bacterium CHB4]
MKHSIPTGFSLFLLLFILTFVGFPNMSLCQNNYVDTITGPYQDYPGPYYIRTFVNFVEKPSDVWLSNWNLAEEANAVLATLNDAYNEHNIFFIPYFDPCSDSAPFDSFTTNLTISQIRQQLQDLGLVHTFLPTATGEGCAETPGICGDAPPCYCCGDYVCDTPPHSNANITAASNCSHLK